MKFVFLFFASWLAGLAAYLGSGMILYHQNIGRGDLIAVAFWTLLAFAVAFGVLYLPALFALRHRLRGVRPAWAFPVVAVLLGIVPVVLIISFFGGLTLRALASPEACLFYCMFGAVGLVVGFGFAYIHRHDLAA